MTKLPETLPCDVTIGVATFRRGVPTRRALDKIQWWWDMREQGMIAPSSASFHKAVDHRGQIRHDFC